MTVVLLTLALAGVPMVGASGLVESLGLADTSTQEELPTDASAKATLTGGCQTSCTWGGTGTHEGASGTHGDLYFNGALKDSCDGGTECSTSFANQRTASGVCARVTAVTVATGGSDTDEATNQDC